MWFEQHLVNSILTFKNVSTNRRNYVFTSGEFNDILSSFGHFTLIVKAIMAFPTLADEIFH